MFGFAKSSKEPKVEQLYSLEVVESMIKEKVEGHDFLVTWCLMMRILMMR